MRILVYGAGNIGSLYAALLTESGQDTSILARGRRLTEIREHGIRLEDVATKKRTTVHVKAVSRLDATDEYDVVLVVLPRNRVAEVLPALAENRGTPSVVFFGNNAAGSSEMTEALGRDRVLLGFPGAGAINHDGTLRYLILSPREQPTTLGELDGTRSLRVQALADALEGAGFPASISPNMDAWLKTHAAEICPTANALYMAGGDVHGLARSREAMALMLRAVKEGHRVLSALGIPVTPRIHSVFKWLPETVLLFLARRALVDEAAEIKIGHAMDARDEMRTLAAEFRELVRESSVPTPSIDVLTRELQRAQEAA